eukprot:5107557-Pyramimonas_sp.AAC.1
MIFRRGWKFGCHQSSSSSELPLQELMTSSSEAPATPAPQSNNFDRAPDPAIIVCRTQSNVAKQHILPPLASWLSRAMLSEDDIQIESEPLSKRFHIRIKGSVAYAAKKVGMALGALHPALSGFSTWMECLWRY